MDTAATMRITNAWICQLQQNSVELIFGDLTIRNGRILEIQAGNFEAFPDHNRRGDDLAYNADGRVITVPLVNFHDHFYSRLARGLPITGPVDSFIRILENLWWKMDRVLDLKMVEAAAKMGVSESIRHGVTYIFDHHASPSASRGSLEVIKRILDRYGVRGVLCFETSDRNGPELAQQGLDEFVNFAENYADENVKSMLGLHASFTLDDATLEKARSLLKKYDTGIHIHLCEDQIDRTLSLEKYGDFPIPRLEKFSLLNSQSILAHGIHLSRDDYQRISQSKSAIVYNPDSNLNNAVGLPEFHAVPSEIPILVGTDGMHANASRSLKQLFLLARHQKMSSDEAFGWIQKIYFDQHRFVRQYFPDFPGLNIGDRADLIIWDYIPPTPFLKENFWGHFIYGILESPIHCVIQNGRFLMQEKTILGEQGESQFLYWQGRRLFRKFRDA